MTFYGTRMFITVSTRTCHWSLSWIRWINLHPPTAFLYGLKVPLHLCLCLTMFSFFQALRENFFFPFLILPWALLAMPINSSIILS